MSTPVEIDSTELRQFASSLELFNAQLSEGLAALAGQFQRLGETWRDPAYRQFEQEFETLSNNARRFMEETGQTVPRLAALADRVEQVYGPTGIGSSESRRVSNPSGQTANTGPVGLTFDTSERGEINRMLKSGPGIQAQGYLHELAARKTIGHGAVILDQNAGAGLTGGRFPTFDVASYTELASVKSHISAEGSLTENEIRRYLDDFEHMLGITGEYQDGMEPLERYARQVMTARQANPELPLPPALEKQIQSGNLSGVQNYIQRHSLLRIPDEHVRPVAQALRVRAREFPTNYAGLSAESLAERIRGTGLSAAATREICSKGVA